MKVINYTYLDLFFSTRYGNLRNVTLSFFDQQIHECAVDGLSGRGYAVVTSLAFTSLIIVFVAVVYVYRVRNRKLTADQQQADRAVQEANLFLPR